MDYAIGIDIGGTNIKSVAITREGDLLARETTPTDEQSPDWIGRVRAQIAHLELGVGRQAACVGLAAPGLAAPDGSGIVWMQGRLEAIQSVNWQNALAETRPVPVVNDAHAALLGEAWRGAAAGSQNVILLTLGTGVGGGAIVDGRLLRGHLGRAGHLGHVSLNPDGPPDIVGTPGSLEDMIGECTLAARSEGRFARTSELVRAYREGDKEAAAIWLRSIRGLAAGIVSLVNVLDPEVVILGGGIAGAGDALFAPLHELLDQWEWRPTGDRVRIVAAQLGEFAGAIGAAYQAL